MASRAHPPQAMRLLVTGGAGFVGSNLALFFKRDYPDWRVTAFDNLKRRGSELALRRLRGIGVHFVHGDLRAPEDLAGVGPTDVIIDCAAEASVHTEESGPQYVVNTNLAGTFHCLEYARRHDAGLVFLSTSRIYPIVSLRELPLIAAESRFVLSQGAHGQGWSEAGIRTDFPLPGARSLYGTTKLAAELLLAEYGAAYGLRYVINRCGVIAGPWQMGKVDQGFVALWAARHLYGGELSYIGFGGTGKQVRDVLHVNDLYRLVSKEIADLAEITGRTYNVGGGPSLSLSLAELTEACAARAGRRIHIKPDQQIRANDIPWYVTDISEVSSEMNWRPEHAIDTILDELFRWLDQHRSDLQGILYQMTLS